MCGYSLKLGFDESIFDVYLFIMMNAAFIVNCSAGWCYCSGSDLIYICVGAYVYIRLSSPTFDACKLIQADHPS